MESDAYVLTLLWFVTPFPRGGGGNSNGATVQHQRAAGRAHHAQSQAPEGALRLAPGSLCKALQIPQQHVLPLETMTQQSTGHFAHGPKYSRN